MKYTLHSAFAEAQVDTLGGELVSYRDHVGTEYIWQGDPAFWSGRNPVLFPTVGVLREGRVRFGHDAFDMPRHGVARRREFTMKERGEDFAVLELTDDAQTRACYPYSFLLRVRHTLVESGYSTALTVVNPGDTVLPFCIGAHTGFRCPLLPGERFEEYELLFDQPENCPSRVSTPDGCLRHDAVEACLVETDRLPLRHDLFDRVDTLTLEGLRSQGVSLLHAEKGHGIHMNFHDFPMLGIWTKPGADAPFLCIEPWHGCAALTNETGEFTEKPHCVLLGTGERRTFQYTVTTLGG